MSNDLQTLKAIVAKNSLEDYALVVEKELQKYFNSEIKKGFGVSIKEKKLSKNIIEHIKDYVLRPAKRLRASFVFYGYKLLDNKLNDEVVKASMSVELVHAGLLVHDDFMDQDFTRRGKLTTHEYYSSLHIKKKFTGNSKHYGHSMAVNVGDVALFLGHEILGMTNFSPQSKINALNRLSRGIVNTAFGQAFDITLEQTKNANEKDILDLHWAKTSIYTYENPLHIGAILAGADEHQLKIISNYAIPGGIAFQLQDDILGFFGDSKKTGKSSYSDLREGKMTLLISKALENGNKAQIEELRKYWGNPNIEVKEAEIVRRIIIDTGSLEYSKKLAISLAKKAQRAIPEMIRAGFNRDAIEYLDGIAQYMVERDL